MGTDGPTAYDVADRYDEAYFADLADRYRRRNRFARTRIANVFRLLPALAGRSVLDLGCGMGTFTIEAARAGARAVGIDLAASGIAAAARVAAAEGVAGAAFVRADVVALPVAAGSADVVLAADLTEHLDRGTLDGLLAEARRVLRPGGQLVLYTPDRSHLLERLRAAGVLRDGDPSHIGMRSAAELAAAVAAAGFTVARVAHLPSHLPGLSLAERALGRWVPLLRRRAGLVAVRADD
ncbi:MAG: class I SAM-dependent methyltransferase [Gemmatimonadota bacterium]